MIRRAETRDIDRLTDLLYQVQAVHADGRPDLFNQGAKKYTQEELGAILDNDEKPIYVYTDENDVVMGYCFCVYQVTKGSCSLKDRKTMYIDDLCVDSVFRGRHIGQTLYEYVLKVAKENHCDSVTLNVWELNTAARAFYEKCGLAPLKTTMEQVLTDEEN